MRILITGIAGLLGANFSRYLLSQGHEVSGIDDLSGGYLESILGENFKFYHIDLQADQAVDWIFAKERPEVVYHFAAYAAEGLSPFIRRYNYMNNVVASANVINACVNHGVKKIVFTSSMAVYGKGTPPYREYDTLRPVDPYGVAKYAVEMDLRCAYEQFGLEYSIVRPHNIIGVYQNIWDRYRNVIGIWIRQCLKGEPITIFGDGTQVRAFSDVGFYMKPLERLATDHNGEVFNLGADKTYTINEASEIVLSVAAARGHASTRQYLEARHEVHSAHCNHFKARDLLDFKDGTDLRETVERMFVWAETQPDREVRKMEYEVDKNLYSFWRDGHRTPLYRAA